MSTITYKSAGQDVRVYVDGRHAGTIKRGAFTGGCWRYQPKNSKLHGEASHSIEDVKRSLES
jgi:hypothetical protein